MKSLRLHGVGDLKLEVEPAPVPAEGETLVQVTAVGICGSDLHWFDQGAIGDARLTKPLVLGHEFAGVLENGARVAVDPAIPCGHCEMCLEGNPNLCPQVRFAGHGLLDGALREFAAWPSTNLYPLPGSISDAEGALLEPLGVALHAIDLGHLSAGMTVGVFGCGPIGLLIVQLARASGASRIIATDKLDHRLDAARTFGATVTIRAREGEENQAVWEAAGRRGVDVAFEAAGEDEAVDVAVAAARPGARVVLAGIPSGDRTSFTASTARRKGLTLKLSRRMKGTYPRALALVEAGQVNLLPLVTHSFPLEQGAEAFEVAQRREGLKVIVTPNS